MTLPRISDELLGRVDASCDAFEAEWKSGPRPSLEAYLSAFAEAEHSAALQALLAVELEYRHRSGDLVTVSEYEARFPNHQRVVLETIDRFQAHSRVEDPTQPLLANGATHYSSGSGGPQLVRVSSLGPYELMELLGRGGMGTVFKARHTRLNKFVAIKVLPESLMKNEQAVARFDREMKAVGALEHPNIVRAMDADEDHGTHYLVMEYVEGQDAQAFVKEKGPLEVPEACRLIRDAALALDYAHRFGLVHRDIKPSNLLITTTGQLKVLDLGLARLAKEGAQEDGLTDTGVSLGTPDYMAPEQWNDSHTVDHRTDLYALGCTLYYLIVGHAPYATEQFRTVIGKLTAHAQGLIPSLRDVRAEVPQELDALYQHLLAKNPDQRVASASELVRRIEPFCLARIPTLSTSNTTPADSKSAEVTSEPSVAGPAVAFPETRSLPQPGRRKTPWIVGIASAAFLAVVVALFFNRPENVSEQSLVETVPEIPVETPPAAMKLHQPTEPKTLNQPNEPGDTDAPEKVTSPPVVETKIGWHGWPAEAPAPAIAPFTAEQARAHQKAWADYLQVPLEHTNGVGMKFRLIPPGEFLMGNSEAQLVELRKRIGEPSSNLESTAPQHRVIFTVPFYAGVTEVTQKEYESVIGKVPSQNQSDVEEGKTADNGSRPVGMVSWFDAIEFCSELSKKEKLTPSYGMSGNTLMLRSGNGYRLLTESQWEFACRAGTETIFWVGDDADKLKFAAWTDRTTNNQTRRVAALRSNPFGLFDVHGNVYEWVQDGWSENYNEVAKQPAINPQGRHYTVGHPVIRGGAVGDPNKESYSAQRQGYPPTNTNFNVGFRVALPVPAVRAIRKSTGPWLPDDPEEKPLLASTISSELPAGESANLFAKEGWIDVLPLIDVGRDKDFQAGGVGENRWRMEGKQLAVDPDGKLARILLPLPIESVDYEVELDVSRTGELDDGFVLDLPIAGKWIPVLVNRPPQGDRWASIFVDLDDGSTKTLRIHLTRSQPKLRLTAFVDDAVVFEWEGEHSLEKSEDAPLVVNDAESSRLPPNVAGLLVFSQNPHRFSAIRLKLHDGTLLVDDPRSTAPDAPSFVTTAPLTHGLIPRPAVVEERPRWQVFVTEPVDCVEAAWSPDGRWIACGEQSGVVKLYAAETRTLVGVMRGSSPMQQIDWHPKSERFLVASNDGKVTIWTITGLLERTIAAHNSAIRSAKWSHNGDRFATGGDYGDSALRVWTSTGELAWSRPVDGFATGLAWNADDTVLAVGTGAQELLAFDAATGELPRPGRSTVNRHHALPTSDRTGELLAVRGPWSHENRELAYLQILNPNNWQVTADITSPVPVHGPNEIAISPDGQHIAAASQDAWVRVWDIQSNKITNAYPTGSVAFQVGWDSEGKRVVFPTGHGAVGIGHVTEGRPTEVFGSPRYRQVSVAPTGTQAIFLTVGARARLARKSAIKLPEQELTCAAWLDGGESLLYWPRGSGTGGLIDCTSGDIKSEFTSVEGAVDLAAVAPQGDTIATWMTDNKLHLWSFQGTLIRTLENQAGVRSLGFSPAGDRVVIAYHDKSLALIQVETGAGESITVETEKAFDRIHWVANDRLISQSADADVSVWSLREGRLERQHALKAQEVIPPTLSGEPLLLVSNEKKRWEVKTIDLATKFVLDDLPANVSASYAEGKPTELTLWCSDQILRTWNRSTGEMLRLVVPLPHDQAITFDPTGKVISQTADAEEELTYAIEQSDGSLKPVSRQEVRDLATQ